MNDTSSFVIGLDQGSVDLHDIRKATQAVDQLLQVMGFVELDNDLCVHAATAFVARTHAVSEHRAANSHDFGCQRAERPIATA